MIKSISLTLGAFAVMSLTACQTGDCVSQTKLDTESTAN